MKRFKLAFAIAYGFVIQIMAGLALADGTASHQVTFDLGEHGVRTGGGELAQIVKDGESAVAPEVAIAAGEQGWWRFAGWNVSFASVTNVLAMRAIYEPTLPNDAKVFYVGGWWPRSRFGGMEFDEYAMVNEDIVIALICEVRPNMPTNWHYGTFEIQINGSPDLHEDGWVTIATNNVVPFVYEIPEELKEIYANCDGYTRCRMVVDVGNADGTPQIGYVPSKYINDMTMYLNSLTCTPDGRPFPEDVAKANLKQSCYGLDNWSKLLWNGYGRFGETYSLIAGQRIAIDYSYIDWLNFESAYDPNWDRDIIDCFAIHPNGRRELLNLCGPGWSDVFIWDVPENTGTYRISYVSEVTSEEVFHYFVDVVEPNGLERMQELALDAEPATVTNAIESAGFADTAVMDAIGGDAAKYAAFKTWADTVKDGDGNLAGEAAVMASTNAAVSFLLGADALFVNEPEIVITGLAIADGDATRLGGDASPHQANATAMRITVEVKDGEDVVKVAEDKVAAMFEATSDLRDWTGAARLEPTIQGEPVTNPDNTMTFTVVPGDGAASSAFLRVRVK